MGMKPSHLITYSFCVLSLSFALPAHAQTTDPNMVREDDDRIRIDREEDARNEARDQKLARDRERADAASRAKAFKRDAVEESEVDEEGQTDADLYKPYYNTSCRSLESGVKLHASASEVRAAFELQTDKVNQAKSSKEKYSAFEKATQLNSRLRKEYAVPTADQAKIFKAAKASCEGGQRTGVNVGAENEMICVDAANHVHAVYLVKDGKIVSRSDVRFDDGTPKRVELSDGDHRLVAQTDCKNGRDVAHPVHGVSPARAREGAAVDHVRSSVK